MHYRLQDLWWHCGYRQESTRHRHLCFEISIYNKSFSPVGVKVNLEVWNVFKVWIHCTYYTVQPLPHQKYSLDNLQPSLNSLFLERYQDPTSRAASCDQSVLGWIPRSIRQPSVNILLHEYQDPLSNSWILHFHCFTINYEGGKEVQEFHTDILVQGGKEVKSFIQTLWFREGGKEVKTCMQTLWFREGGKEVYTDIHVIQGGKEVQYIQTL